MTEMTGAARKQKGRPHRYCIFRTQGGGDEIIKKEQAFLSGGLSQS
jgi:hypothetical protein